METMSEEGKAIEAKAEKNRNDLAEEMKIKESQTVLIRHPKNGFIMHCSPEMANNLLRKNKGYRRVSAPPVIDMANLKLEV